MGAMRAEHDSRNVRNILRRCRIRGQPRVQVKKKKKSYKHADIPYDAGKKIVFCKISESGLSFETKEVKTAKAASLYAFEALCK